MTIQVDSREKAKAIKQILDYFEREKINYYISKLYIADYSSLDNPRYVIDRKQNLSEIACNLDASDNRFRNELKRAHEIGVKVAILCEHGGSVKGIEDVKDWINPIGKKHPCVMSGERIYRLMKALSAKYGVEWYFCDKKATGRRIYELLTDGEKKKGT